MSINKKVIKLSLLSFEETDVQKDLSDLSYSASKFQFEFSVYCRLYILKLFIFLKVIQLPFRLVTYIT